MGAGDEKERPAIGMKITTEDMHGEDSMALEGVGRKIQRLVSPHND